MKRSVSRSLTAVPVCLSRPQRYARGQHLFLVLVTILLISGCHDSKAKSSANRPARPVETNDVNHSANTPTWNELIGRLHREKTDRLVISRFPVTDQMLREAGSLTILSTLICDHPDNQITVAGARLLADLPNLVHLRIRAGNITDTFLQEISASKSLQILNLPETECTDAGLAHLAHLPQLVQLRLGSRNIGLNGLKSLASFPSLLRLHFLNVPIDDEGLLVLQNLSQLESLYLDGALASDAAFERLFQARPTLHVHLNQLHHSQDPQRDRHQHP